MVPFWGNYPETLNPKGAFAGTTSSTLLPWSPVQTARCEDFFLSKGLLAYNRELSHIHVHIYKNIHVYICQVLGCGVLAF